MPDGTTPQPAVLSSLETQAALVSRGVRPAAMEAVQDRYVNGAREVACQYGLFALFEDLADGWKAVWIYKHPHIGFVIEKTGRQPATAFDHWVLGKVFGYSEEAIADYLLRLGLSADLDELSLCALRTGR